jgi:hypothetical protein
VRLLTRGHILLATLATALTAPTLQPHNTLHRIQARLGHTQRLSANAADKLLARAERLTQKPERGVYVDHRFYLSCLFSTAALENQ